MHEITVKSDSRRFRHNFLNLEKYTYMDRIYCSFTHKCSNSGHHHRTQKVKTYLMTEYLHKAVARNYATTIFILFLLRFSLYFKKCNLIFYSVQLRFHNFAIIFLSKIFYLILETDLASVLLAPNFTYLQSYLFVTKSTWHFKINFWRNLIRSLINDFINKEHFKYIMEFYLFY